jgi:amino acid transporter
VADKKALKKEIGLLTLVSLGVGGMVGSGIFALPAVMGAYAGPGLILGILFSGIITIFLGLAYAELGAAFPLTGGPYSLPRLALGDFGGFMMGWGYFIYLFTGTAGIIAIFVVYLGYYYPGLANGVTLTPLGIYIAVAALWVFTIINILGVKWGGLYSVITTIGRLIPLLIFAMVGLAYFNGANFTPFIPYGIMGVTITIPLFFWSFTGFEAIVIPAEEVKKPSFTIPWGMFLSVLITIFVYLIIAIAFVGMINWEGLSMKFQDWGALGKLSSPLSDVAEGLKMHWLAAVVVIGAIIATAGSGGSWVLFQGRMPFAMATDKLFWSIMAKVDRKRGTPIISLIFTSMLSTICLIAIPNFPSVALIASITVIVPYAAATVSLLILRKTKKEVHRPFKLPMAKTISLLGFIFSTYLIYWAAWPWTFVGMTLMFTGYGAFLFVKKSYEWKRNLWLPIYLFLVLLVSVIGDKRFVFNNFTSFVPLNILTFPIDIITLTFIAVVTFVWAYKVNIKYKAASLQTDVEK